MKNIIARRSSRRAEIPGIHSAFAPPGPAAPSSLHRAVCAPSGRGALGVAVAAPPRFEAGVSMAIDTRLDEALYEPHHRDAC